MRHLIIALAEVKIAAARANADDGALDPRKLAAIEEAAREIIANELRDEFPIDVFQGGAGTSTNMNMNEVIANRASEILGGQRGQDRLVHAHDDVNRSQSTNDAYATAVRLSMVYGSRLLRKELTALSAVFRDKQLEFAGIAKLGRTQLQDAVQMTLGDEFGAFATTLSEDVERLAETEKHLCEINLGGTAIGSGIAASESYRRNVLPHLRHVTGLPVERARDLYEASWDMGVFMLLSGLLKRTACKLSKIANDLRLLSSGPTGGIGEIKLPALQPGSSIMPAKVNPVAAEAVNQVCFYVYGLDTTIGNAAEAGQLQLNAMEPVIAFSLHQALSLLTNVVKSFAETCVRGIEAAPQRCSHNLGNSSAFATELVSTIGYEAATVLAKSKLAPGDGAVA
ncbi:aspartate ammonia-lyase [Bosea lathyri]|uniref:Aspartate ammonia-lyase n=2 Tax=Bosea lathyri TaxID=1036778 RepID=A0A1H6C965_9HYPH|nr:aspartate ammonia-lyase [Bosea lathyri]